MSKIGKRFMLYFKKHMCESRFFCCVFVFMALLGMYLIATQALLGENTKCVVTDYSLARTGSSKYTVTCVFTLVVNDILVSNVTTGPVIVRRETHDPAVAWIEFGVNSTHTCSYRKNDNWLVLKNMNPYVGIKQRIIYMMIVTCAVFVIGVAALRIIKKSGGTFTHDGQVERYSRFDTASATSSDGGDELVVLTQLNPASMYDGDFSSTRPDVLSPPPVTTPQSDQARSPYDVL